MTDNACGSCTACCRVFAIAPLKKPAGDWCQHCAIGEGCKIYSERPSVCVDFECLWLQAKKNDLITDDALRPDHCKVVFSPTTNPMIMSAITMPGAPTAWQKGQARQLIDSLVKDGVRVVAGPPASTRKIMIDRLGEREVEMTPPDEDGMQWNIPHRSKMK